MEITVKQVSGGIPAMKQVTSGIGFAVKLLNTQDIQPFVDSITNNILKQSHFAQFKVIDAEVYHKKHSKFKWLTVYCDVINKDVQISIGGRIIETTPIEYKSKS